MGTGAMRDEKIRHVDELTMAELWDIYRLVLSEKRRKPTKSAWDGTRRELIEAIEKFAPGRVLIPVRKRSVRVARKVRHVARPGVGNTARELLQKVIGKTPDGEPVGMSYQAMLKIVKKKFPESKVSYAHLRWYATKLTLEDVKVPAHRERSIWK